MQRIIWSSFLLKRYSGAISSVTTVSTTISCLDATPLLQYYYTLLIGISANISDTAISGFSQIPYSQIRVFITRHKRILPDPSWITVYSGTI